jgi:CRISPR-associated RAMP protein (TIGR02581 family)
MLKRLINELRCKLTITTNGPVLVKSGHASVSGPDMTPVRIYRNGRSEVYLPGSSLKGVIRSHVEKVCRTLEPGLVCNPFIRATSAAVTAEGKLLCPDFSDVACGDKFEVREKGEVKVDEKKWRRPKEELSNAQVYSDSCPICRLFGSNSFIGRLSIGDGYLTTTGRTETRDGVGIDRLTGGAAHGAKFELESVSAGVTFESDILLRNFECWQVGILLVVAADLRDGLMRIGSGRSRGLGDVRAELSALTINTLAATAGRSVDEVWGLGRFQSDSERGAYGTFADDIMKVEPAPAEDTKGLRRIATFPGDTFVSLEGAACAEFTRRLNGWPERNGMRWHNDWQRG